MRRTTESIATGVGSSRSGFDAPADPASARRRRFSDEILRARLSNSAWTAPIRRIWSGLGTCLMYHRICTDDFTPDPSFWPNRELAVRACEFDRQMRHLARHYNCVALPEAVRLLRCGRLPRRSIIVTFDDGYRDNLTLALPILRKHDVPATIYVTTGLIDNAISGWWYELEQIVRRENRLTFEWRGKRIHEAIINARRKHECHDRLSRWMKRLAPADQVRLMKQVRNGGHQHAPPGNEPLSRRQVRELARDPLITVGAHTHLHPVLSRLTPGRMQAELQRASSLLEEWTGQPVTHLAYPFGGPEHAGRREFKMAERLGFESATTTRIGHLHSFHGKRLFALPRIAIAHDDDLARFRWKLSGLECLTRRPLSRIAT